MIWNQSVNISVTVNTFYNYNTIYHESPGFTDPKSVLVSGESLCPKAVSCEMFGRRVGERRREEREREREMLSPEAS